MDFILVDCRSCVRPSLTSPPGIGRRQASRWPRRRLHRALAGLGCEPLATCGRCAMSARRRPLARLRAAYRHRCPAAADRDTDRVPRLALDQSGYYAQSPMDGWYLRPIRPRLISPSRRQPARWRSRCDRPLSQVAPTDLTIGEIHCAMDQTGTLSSGDMLTDSDAAWPLTSCRIRLKNSRLVCAGAMF